MSLLLSLALCAPSALAGPSETAVDFARAQALIEPGLAVDLQVRAELPWAGGTRVRVQHVVHGFPVEGRDLVVHLDPGGRVLRTKGPLAVKGSFDPRPNVFESMAVDQAVDVAAHFGEGSAWEPRTELVAFLDEGDRPHLAWAVDVASSQPFRQWRVFVDAHTAEVLHSRPMSFDARANIFPTNPVESVLTEVDLPGLISDTVISGEYAYVQSCDDWDNGATTCRAASHHAVADADGNFLFAEDATSEDDPMAEVQMYYHLDRVSAWFEEEVGFRHSEPIQGLVNFSYLNAFYGDGDGDGEMEVAFGQGAGIDFAYDGDVVYHEFVHSVVGQVTSLGFFGADEIGVTYAPIALNEGSADLFSLILTGDPLLGAYAGSPVIMGGGAIRDLEPDRRCPDDLYGESHEDGMIWGAMGWNIIDDPAISQEVAMQLFYGTTISWTNPNLKYAEAAASLAETADDLLAAGGMDQAAHDAVMTHLDASGLPGCVRIIPLDGGVEPTLFAQYIGVADFLGHIPLTAQLSLEVPEGATELTFRVKDWSSNGDMGWTVFVRRGEPVRYDVAAAAGFEIPTVADYDFSIDGSGKGRITLPDPELGLELEPGATYYFSVASRNLGGITVFDLVQGETTLAGSVECCDALVADEGTDDSEGKGCGCQSGHAPVSGWLALLALAALRRRQP